MTKAKMTIDVAEALCQQGRIAEAKAICQALLAAHGEDVSALHLLALICYEEKSFADATTYLQAAIRIQPEEPLLYLHLANALKASGLYAQAAEALQELIRLQPAAAAYNNLGTVYFAQAKLPEAQHMFDEALKLAPHYTEAYYNLGLVLSKLQRRPEALNAYQALLALEPTHPGAHFQLGVLYMQLGRYQEAIPHFAAITATQAFYADAQTNLASCYLRCGELKAAAKHYEVALAKRPRDVSLLFNLGVIAQQQGRLPQAQTYYEQALALDATQGAVHNNLAVIALALRQKEVALAHFEQALALDPSNQAIQHTVRLLKQDAPISASPPAYVSQLFDAYADHYDAHMRHDLDYHVPEQLYAACKHHDKSGPLAILDLGCGTGLCGEVFRDRAKTLIGVDLSANMLAVAATKGCYTQLIHCDIESYLATQTCVFDLVLAADVLVYFGDLAALFTGVSRVLKVGGLFVFTTEVATTSTYQIGTTGRFAHQRAYLERLALQHQFAIVSYETPVLRRQEGEAVMGHLFVLQRI